MPQNGLQMSISHIWLDYEIWDFKLMKLDEIRLLVLHLSTSNTLRYWAMLGLGECILNVG